MGGQGLQTDDFPEPATATGGLQIDAFPDCVTTTLHVDEFLQPACADFLTPATPEPGAPERCKEHFPGDADSVLQRLAAGKGVESGRLPEELNGGIDRFPKVNEKLAPRPP